MRFELGVAGIYDPRIDGPWTVSELTQWYSDRLEEIIREADRFALIAGRAVRLAVRVGTAEAAADDLTAAMTSRTAINLACGIIMGQNRCSQADAMAILMKVSSHRNQKLRDVAEEIVLKVSGEEPATYFDK